MKNITGRRFLPLITLCMALALGVGVTRGAAQGANQGSLSGQVVDAGTDRPLTGATISIEPAGAGSALDPERRAFLTAGRATITDPEGRYRFDGLAPGEYRVRVSRAGYRAVAVTVELRGAVDSRVSVGLIVEPIQLEPVEVTTESTAPFVTGAERDPAVGTGARASAARSRQEAHLPSDTRELTYSDVVEAVTLGETDLFRALQRLPGVATRDDFTAELWTRGAPWDQTRVYFDGLPLFNPLHGMGLFSGVNPDAIGSAMFHPGVRPASIAEGAAGAVDLVSRPGGGDGRLRGNAELSLVSARLALDQRSRDDRWAWLVAGRRTFHDWIAAVAAAIADDEEIRLPYSFSDYTARLDWQPGTRSSIEASALLESDRLAGTIPDVLHGSEAGWGNRLARISYLQRAHGGQARATVGFSGYRAHSRDARDTREEPPYSAPRAEPMENRLDHFLVGGSIEPERGSGSDWKVGAELVNQRMRYSGETPRVYAGYAGATSKPIERRSDLAILALWAESRWTAGENLTLDAGVRVDGGRAAANTGPVRFSPRLRARYRIGRDVTVSAGLGRSYQYVQALGPTGASFHAGFHASHVWIHADSSVPALLSDVGTFGAEAWLGEQWLASLTTYLRESSGLVLPDPTPGPLEDRDLFVTGRNSARGFEVALRRLAGRWTTSLAYSHVSSEISASGFRYPSPAERRHTVDATLMTRLGRGWGIGAAWGAASGAPFTRIHSPYYSCTSPGEECQVPLIGEPGANRSPPYASLDLLAELSRNYRRFDLTAYLQLRNALRRDNPATYVNSQEWCPGSGFTSACPAGYQLRDNFEHGLPFLPLVGIRVLF